MNNPDQKLRHMIALGLFLIPLQAAGAEDETFKLFEEEAKVVTASRREQSVAQIPLAVDVVTPEEIRASGAANIWDLLRFRVGMDVIDGRSTDGNRAVVSERGFPREFAGNLLVLVDGRSVYSANTAGVYWEQLPVQLQDIERIEIIRGPNTAIYGTGAGVGVVNFITKKPQGGTSLETDTRGGGLRMAQAFQAAETSIKKGALRLSHTFQQEDGFPLASNIRVPGQDYMRKNVTNLRAEIPLSDRSSLELFGGDSVGTAGALGSTYADIHQYFQMLKFSHRFSEDSVLEASMARNDFLSNIPKAFLDNRLLQYDGEILHRLSWRDKRLNTTYGASGRNAQVTAPQIYGSFRPRLEVYRGFVQQAVKPADSFSIQGALSVESSNLSGAKPNYQVASVWAPTPEHAVRASYSLSYTLRNIFPIFANYPSSPSTRLVGDTQNKPPYKINSYEAGYYGTYLDKRLTADASLFYTKIENFHTGVAKVVSFAPLLVNIKFKIYDDAIARGAELKLKYRFGQARWVYANYTYEHVTDTAGDRGFTTDNVPTHKLNVGGAVELIGGLSASADLGYKDKQFIRNATATTNADIPVYWRLDARLAYKLSWYKQAELYIAGQNLLKPTHVEFPDGLAVPRTYSGGVSIQFGGGR